MRIRKTKSSTTLVQRNMIRRTFVLLGVEDPIVKGGYETKRDKIWMEIT